MPSIFPGAIDPLPNPGPYPPTTMANDSHRGQHSRANDAIRAVQAKLKDAPTLIDLRDWDTYDPSGANDSLTAVQGAIDQAAATGGAEVRGHGVATVTGNVRISTSGVELRFPQRAPGQSSNQRGDPDLAWYDDKTFVDAAEARTPGLCWGGAASGGPVLTIEPTGGVILSGVGFHGAIYAGEDPAHLAAAIGLRLCGATQFDIDLHALEFTDAALDITPGPMSDLRYVDRSIHDGVIRRLVGRHWVNPGRLLRVRGNGLHSTLGLLTATAADPTVITTDQAHGLQNGLTVTISESGTTPSLDGTWTVTRIDATRFSVPLAVTVAAGGGTITTNFLAKCDSYGIRFGHVYALQGDGASFAPPLDIGWSDHHRFERVRIMGYNYAGRPAPWGGAPGVVLRAAAEAFTAPAQHVFDAIGPGPGGMLVEGTEVAPFPSTDCAIDRWDPDFDGPPSPSLGTGAGVVWLNQLDFPAVQTLAGPPRKHKPRQRVFDTTLFQEVYAESSADASIWRSTQPYWVSMTGATLSTSGIIRTSLPFNNLRNICITRFVIQFFLGPGAALSATDKWTVALELRRLGATSATAPTGNIVSTLTLDSGALGTLRTIDSGSLNFFPDFDDDVWLECHAYKTGAPGDITLTPGVQYRTITVAP